MRRPRRSRSSPTRSASSIDGLRRPGPRQHPVLPNTPRLLLYAADHGAIEIRWSQPILDEMSRNLQQNLPLSPADTARLELLMNYYIEDALVDIEPEDLEAVGAVHMDVKDRHVLAAALSAQANVLLTQNTRHFPSEWMSQHDIQLMTAGELLVRLAEQFPDEMRAAHAATLRYSPKVGSRDPHDSAGDRRHQRDRGPPKDRRGQVKAGFERLPETGLSVRQAEPQRSSRTRIGRTRP